MNQFCAKVKFIILLLNLTWPVLVSGQSTTAQHWKQQVDYNIKVELDDNKHELQGVISMEYVNNSPDTLPMLYIHVWPNAYKNNGTAFAKQQLENGDTEFWYASNKERGYIDGFKWKANGIPVSWELDSTHIDIGRLFLDKPLLPGEKVTISTPFHVKLPNSFSRLGHVGQQYQITQWYPKPAVYDHKGWHPMPYLDQGEFFSEYGSFDVYITLPENYVVGASGDLQNEDELAWLKEKAEATAALPEPLDYGSFPPSAENDKTLHYHLENAHDFAWFADKRYYVLQGEVTLPNDDKTVTTWAMFTELDWKHWKKSLPYIDSAVYYYSKWLGAYPYNNATAVEGALSAGGGMEYPTITIIGGVVSDRMLETVIVHEVGHFWLYGILGSNERQYPWMDEGINSFYENRYVATVHPDWMLINGVPRLSRFFGLDRYKRNYAAEFLYLFSARQNEDQPMGLHSEVYTPMNYGTIVYAKSAVAFNHLRGYLGDEVFDKAMQAYYDAYKFDHPYPEDLQRVLEEETGKDLSWFFQELVNTTVPVDYVIKKAKRDRNYDDEVLITISNRTGIAAPFSLSAINRDGSIAKTVWYPGVAKDTTVRFPYSKEFRYYRIDAEEQMVEYNRSNNTYRTGGLFRRSEPIKFQLFGSIDDPYKNELFFSPFLGWNNYDKTLIGLALYNHMLPFKNLEFELLPMYGTATKTFNGVGRINWYKMPVQGRIKHIRVGISGRRFSYLLFPEVAQYSKIEPSLGIVFKPKTARHPLSFAVEARSVNIWQDIFLIGEKQTPHYYINEARFELTYNKTLTPMYAEARIQQGNNFMNLSVTGKFTFKYMKAKESVNLRVFAGGFLFNSKSGSDIMPPNPVFQLSGTTNNPNQSTLMFQKDYMFDHYYLDRNGFDPIIGKQVVEKDGGFRSFTIIGDNNKFLGTVTVDATAPGPIPIKAFAGAGVYVDGQNKVQPVAEFGLALAVIPGIFEINVPFVTTNNIKLNQETGLGLDKFYEKITFTLNLSRIEPFKQLRSFKL